MVDAQEMDNTVQEHQYKKAKDEADGKPAGSSGGSGARTIKVDKRGRNVMSDVEGPATVVSQDKKHLTVQDPRALLGLRKTDGSSAFVIRDRRKKSRKKK